MPRRGVASAGLPILGQGVFELADRFRDPVVLVAKHPVPRHRQEGSGLARAVLVVPGLPALEPLQQVAQGGGVPVG